MKKVQQLQKNSIQDSMSIKKLPTANNNINNQQKKIQENKGNKENIIPKQSIISSQIKQVSNTKVSVEKSKIVDQALSTDNTQVMESIINGYFKDKDIVNFCKELELPKLRDSNEARSKKLLERSLQLLETKVVELTEFKSLKVKPKEKIASAEASIKFLQTITTKCPDIQYGSVDNITNFLKNHNGYNNLQEAKQKIILKNLPLAIITYYLKGTSEHKEFQELRELVVKENNYFLEETNKEITILQEKLTIKEREMVLLQEKLQQQEFIFAERIKEKDIIIKEKDDILEQLIQEKDNEIIIIKTEYEVKCREQEESSRVGHC